MSLKKNRINKKEIEDVFKFGRFINSPNLSLKFFIDSNKNKETLIGFITPKTVSNKAVDRNLLRRRGYFILNKHFLLKCI